MLFKKFFGKLTVFSLSLDSASTICVPEKIAMFLKNNQNVSESARGNLATLCVLWWCGCGGLGDRDIFLHQVTSVKTCVTSVMLAECS